MAQKLIDPNFLTEAPQTFLDVPGLNYDKIINPEENIGIDQITLNSFANKTSDEEYSVCKIIKVFPPNSAPKPGSPLDLISNKDEKDIKPIVQAIGINISSRDQFIPLPSNIHDMQGIDKYTQGLFTYIYSDSESVIAQNLKVNDIVYVEYDLGDNITGTARILASKPISSGKSGRNQSVPVSNPITPKAAQPQSKGETLASLPVQGDPNREYDAILVCGLEKTPNRPTYLTFEQQLATFKKGYGLDRNVRAFSYTVSDSELGSILQKNNIPVFLFSAGASKMRGVLAYLKDKTKVFVIEPWNKNGGYLPTFKLALSKGVPAANFYIGATTFTGQGLPGASSSNSNGNHFGALEIIGRLKSNVR